MDLSAQTKYKVFLDESYKHDVTEERRKKWQYYELHGKYGMIYPYSASQLAVYFNTHKVSRKFLKRWFLITEGDFERVFLIPDSDLELAASSIEAKKRRQYSPETLAKLRKNIKFLSRERGSRPSDKRFS